MPNRIFVAILVLGLSFGISAYPNPPISQMTETEAVSTFRNLVKGLAQSENKMQFSIEMAPQLGLLFDRFNVLTKEDRENQKPRSEDILHSQESILVLLFTLCSKSQEACRLPDSYVEYGIDTIPEDVSLSRQLDELRRMTLSLFQREPNRINSERTQFYYFWTTQTTHNKFGLARKTKGMIEALLVSGVPLPPSRRVALNKMLVYCERGLLVEAAQIERRKKEAQDEEERQKKELAKQKKLAARQRECERRKRKRAEAKLEKERKQEAQKRARSDAKLARLAPVEQDMDFTDIGNDQTVDEALRQLESYFNGEIELPQERSGIEEGASPLRNPVPLLTFVSTSTSPVGDDDDFRLFTPLPVDPPESCESDSPFGGTYEGAIDFAESDSDLNTIFGSSAHLSQ